jgi:hypothetical protein
VIITGQETRAPRRCFFWGALQPRFFHPSTGTSAFRRAPGLRAQLQKIPEIDAVGEAENGGTAVEPIGRLRPDLVLLDVQMPVLNGFQVLERISHAPEIILITVWDRLVRDFTNPALSSDHSTINGANPTSVFPPFI